MHSVKQSTASGYFFVILQAVPFRKKEEIVEPQVNKNYKGDGRTHLKNGTEPLGTMSSCEPDSIRWTCCTILLLLRTCPATPERSLCCSKP